MTKVSLITSVLCWSSLLVGLCDARSERPVQQTEEGDAGLRGVAGINGRRLNKNAAHHKPKLKQENHKESSGSRVFVKYKDDSGREGAKTAALELLEEFENHNLLVVSLDENGRKALEWDDGIEFLEPDHPIAASAAGLEYVGDRNLAEQRPWGLDMIESDAVPMGDHPVKVCLIDTGYAQGHPDLPFATGDDSIRPHRREPWLWDIDFNGHGTHVAGIVAAISGNDIGVAGVGDIPLHIARGLDDNADGYESDTLIALQQCLDAGAKVINLSLGGPQTSVAAQQAFRSAVVDSGALVVAAAGNEGRNVYAYPASNDHVISVGAVYEWGRYWEGSNYGDQVELAAPGYGILSTATTLSAVHTSDFSFSATQLTGSRRQQIAGPLAWCGPGSYVCTDAWNAICLIALDQSTLRTVTQNCVDGGAVGAVVFSVAGDEDPVGLRTNLPTVFVTRERGTKLIDYVGTRVEFGHSDADRPVHTYSVYRGTSMATPHVAAVAAKVWSHFPECSNAQIRYALDITASDKGMTGCDWDYGFGIVNARAAYQWLLDRGGCTDSADYRDPDGRGGCRATQ